jgi:hypothetical protein
MNIDKQLMNQFTQSSCKDVALLEQVSTCHLYNVIDELCRTNDPNKYLKQCIFEEVRKRERL